MSVEVACGNCQGRLLIETPGVVVACPHCGTHISIPNPEAAIEPPATSDSKLETEVTAQSATGEQNSESVAVPQEVTASGAANRDAPADTTNTAPIDEPAEAPPWMPPAEQPTDPIVDEPGVTDFPDFSAREEQSALDAPAVADSVKASDNAAADPAIHVSPDIAVSDAADAEAADIEFATPVSEQPPPSNIHTPEAEESATDALVQEPVMAAAAIVAEPVADDGDTIPNAEVIDTVPAALDEPGVQPIDEPVVTPPATVATNLETAKRAKAVPQSLFMLVASYASAVTIAFLFLLFSRGESVNRKELESLPDLKPPMKNEKIALRLIGEGESMNPGHLLKLGESQRYGNVKLTPLKVTRGTIQFDYYSGDRSKTKEPTEPVLKLWLRFENVSQDQEFAPLDRLLVMKSVQDKKQLEFGRFRANNFVCRLADKGDVDSQVLMYNNTPYVSASDWNLRGQTIGKNFKPGDSLETYIPTEEEGLDQLKGELVWRIQFRKGYNPESYRGVTTLIEVRFHSDDIQSG